MSVPPTALEQSVLWMLRGGTYTIDALRLHLRTSRREVEEAVEDLRLRGEPIVAVPHGLRLTEDPDELARYVESRRRRIASIYLGNRALRNKARRMKEAADQEAGLTLWPAA